MRADSLFHSSLTTVSRPQICSALDLGWRNMCEKLCLEAMLHVFVKVICCMMICCLR